jgi:hypothetical protein
VNIDWSHLIWEGRWQALVIYWHALVTDVRTLWWFGPLLVLVVATAGKKRMLRVVKAVAGVFIHTHGPFQ